MRPRICRRRRGPGINLFASARRFELSENPSEPVPLEPLGVNSIWPKEDRDFTPWLAANLGRLDEATGLRLEPIKVEKRLGEAGRLDIQARQEETDAPVAIERTSSAALTTITSPGCSVTQPPAKRTR